MLYFQVLFMFAFENFPYMMIPKYILNHYLVA